MWLIDPVTNESTNRTQLFTDNPAKIWKGDFLEIHFGPNKGLYKIHSKQYHALSHDRKEYTWLITLINSDRTLQVYSSDLNLPITLFRRLH